jgi:hypothetical protein
MISSYKTLDGGADELNEHKPEENFILVAQQVREQGTREFYVYFIEDFVKKVKSLPCYARYYHEQIVHSRPVKLYFDIEDKSETINEDEFNAAVGDFCLKINDEIIRIVNRPIRPFVVSHAHRTGRFSTHVTFDVQFPNTYNLVHFINECKSKDISLQFVDDQVYSCTSIKSMRSMYSNKMISATARERQCCLLPFGDDGSGGSLFDEELFKQSLITYISPNTPSIWYSQETIDVLSRSMSGMSIVTGNRIVVRPPEELYDKTIKWLKDVKKVHTVKLISASENEFTLRVKPSFYCPVKGDRHDNNGTHLFFTYYLPHMVEMSVFCLKCKSTTPYKESVMIAMGV